jgi:predicted dehydrogenase
MYRVGIAGYGTVGRRRRLCIDAHPDLKLIGICDQKINADGQFDDGVLCFSDYKKLLEKKLDILFVCLTNDIAAEVVISGLNAGYHVFCEKPPGRDINDILNVIDSHSKNSKLKLMYGFNHRFHSSVKDAIRIFNSGGLGKVINIRGMYGKAKLATFNQTDWRTKREVCGGGVLLDQGIHMIDLIRIFGGEFSEIHSMVSSNHWKYDVEDNAYALMRSDSGTVALLHSSATQWRHRFHLDINLEYGSLILSGILSGTKSYGPETLTVVRANPDLDGGNPIENRYTYNRDESWEEEVGVFTRAIKENLQITSGTPNDALQAMRIVYGIYYADSIWRNKFNIPDPK